MQNHLRVARESVWLEMIGIAVFAGLVALAANALRLELNGLPLVLAGIVLALVPALLWLSAFYRQDRIEPEPRQYVIGIFILGALLYQAVGQPLTREVFRAQDWVGANWWIALSGSILVGGLITQFLLYAAVRYTVFYSTEFDQRIDGIIYGAAAGLGYATMQNIQYVVNNGGVDLGVGAITIAVEALSLASLGGVSGYFLGRAKFDKMGARWLPLGLALAAILNGVIDLVLRQVPFIGGDLNINPWYGLLAGVLIAGSTFFVLFRLMSRLRGATENASNASTALAEEPEWIVWVVVIVGLAAAWFVRGNVLDQVRTTSVGQVSVSYPASWSRASATGALFAAEDRTHGGVFGARISVHQIPRADLFPATGGLADAAMNWSLARGKELIAYRLLEMNEVKWQGRDAVRVDYAFLLDSPQGSASGTLPALMRATDVLVVSGDQIFALTFAAERNEFDQLADWRERIIATWRVP
ncbi:MAG: PrsW family intramembrane metalloprotease [Chloroflexi bacterium]|nr:PrsW family intramembrane metalloprotease [Chloroflexota bacterium]